MVAVVQIAVAILNVYSCVLMCLRTHSVAVVKVDKIVRI
jgi:hypothetical protein